VREFTYATRSRRRVEVRALTIDVLETNASRARQSSGSC